MDLAKLKEFLIAANNAGFAGGEEKAWLKENDGSTTITFEKENWKSHDNFFGGEPYGGRIIVSYEGKPFWMMVYYGWVEEGEKADPIYGVLKNALKKMPEEYPFRGPSVYQEEDYSYTNKWGGDVARYSGEEQITFGGKLVYKANYFGGLVDQRR